MLFDTILNYMAMQPFIFFNVFIYLFFIITMHKEAYI